ncbi:MAG: hypothetical protein RIG77_11715 [Cyclobacteriaceae bacterium]
MNIDKIYVACWKHDVNLAKICIASIRYWYPNLPIYLIKDEYNGSFSTKDLEHKWHVAVFENSTSFNQDGYSFLAPLFQQKKERCLFLDPDIVFVGPVLDKLEGHSEDFVVNVEYLSQEQFDSDKFTRYYFDYRKMKALDPSYDHLGYAFNSGQLIGTCGILEQEEFENFFEISNGRMTKKYPDIIPRARDQALLNYILVKHERMGKISVGKTVFMKWPKYENEFISLKEIKDKTITDPFLLHWAGISEFKYISRMTYSNILKFYNDYYYSRFKNKKLLKALDILKLHIINCQRIFPRVPYLLNRKWQKFASLRWSRFSFKVNS